MSHKRNFSDPSVSDGGIRVVNDASVVDAPIAKLYRNIPYTTRNDSDDGPGVAISPRANLLRKSQTLCKFVLAPAGCRHGMVRCRMR